MRLLASLLLLAGLLAVPARAQVEPSRSITVKDEGSVQGRVWQVDFTGSGVSATVSGGVATISIAGSSFPLLAPNGTVTDPSYSWSTSTGTGFYHQGSGVVSFAYSGVRRWTFDSPNNALRLSADGIFTWSNTNGNPDATADVSLRRTAAGVLTQQSNPDTAQAYRVYGSTTGPKYLELKHDATNSIVNAQTGTLDFQINGTTYWRITTSGHLTAVPANTMLILAATAFASLGTPANGTIAYCSDCTFANPCASGGTGAIAKRLNGAWRCD